MAQTSRFIFEEVSVSEFPKTMPLTSRNVANMENKSKKCQNNKLKVNKNGKRPWAAKPKTTAQKEVKAVSLSKQDNPLNISQILKSKEIEMKTVNINQSFLKAEIPSKMLMSTLKLEKTHSNTIQNGSKGRGRINSCKVSLKRVFPQANQRDS